MDRGELEQAAKANSALMSAERDLDALLSQDFKVVGIMIDTGDGGLRPITLQKGGSGTGSISGLGYPDGLQQAMTQALYDYHRAKVAGCRCALEALGIEIAA